MRYQFTVDGRPAAPVRKAWEEAAEDVVRQGYGVYTSQGIRLSEEAEIARLGETE